MTDRQQVLFKDLLITTKDGDWGKGEPTLGHVPFSVIRGTDFDAVRIGAINTVPIRYLSASTVARRTLQEGDILLETAGGSPGRPTGRSLYISDQVMSLFPRPLTCASFARFLRVDTSKTFPAYIYRFLQCLYLTRGIEQYQIQHTGVARFQFTQFASSQYVALPSMCIQQAVAEVLGALDDKIASNAKLIAAAERLSATIFQSIAYVGEQAERPLTELARFVNGRAYTKDATGTGRIVIRIAELNSGISESTVRNDIEVPADNIARPGDLLFAWSGSLTVHRWFHSEGIVNQHIFKVIPAAGHPIWLAHQLLIRKLAEFKAIAADKATTMGHIQRRHLDEPVNVPAPQAIERVHPVMDSLWSAALSFEQESLDLVALRDALLPHLMSGRLRVKDAEKQVEAVV